MNRLRIACALLAVPFCVHAAGPAPSEVMRKIPPIPDPVEAKDCAAIDPLLAHAQQQAMADMMQAQKLAMGGARAGRVSDRQGELIARLMDPEVTMCEAQVFQEHDGQDVAETFRQQLHAIQEQTRNEIENTCPVIGMADYRDEACVDPIRERRTRKERAAVSAYIVKANAALAGEIEAYAQCAATHEQLAAEAEAAQLLPQYTGIAFSNQAKGWQQVDMLANRYRDLCRAAANALEYLEDADRAW
ncbi:MAG TPA: hypothetical protein VF254_09270 [Gammaproteobacteria bacterium]